jgi:hypothetical protein
MAERALLVRREGPDRWLVSTAQWGGTDAAIAAVCAGTPPTALESSWHSREPASTFRTVVANLDYLGAAALYRIDRRQSARPVVTVFSPLWFGLPLSAVTPQPGVGGLVAVGSLAAVHRYRRWFREAKGWLADGITAGLVTPAMAVTTLYRAITRLHDRERYVTLAPAAAVGFSPGTGPDTP